MTWHDEAESVELDPISEFDYGFRKSEGSWMDMLELALEEIIPMIE